MKPMHRTLLAITALGACTDLAAPPALTGPASASSAAVRAVASGVITLPTFGGNEAQAVAINDDGAVVGYASATNGTRTVFAVTYAAKWVRDPVDGAWHVRALGESRTTNGEPIKPAPGGLALALNERGDAVGIRRGSALLWLAAGGEITLPDGVVALGMNNAGIIVGGTQWGNTGVALVWIPDVAAASGWSPRRLRSLERGTFSLATAINEGGVITGFAVSAAGVEQAVVWLREGDGWSAPVLLFGREASNGSSGGFGINAGGDVVGYYNACSDCGFRAYSWPAAGGSVDLTSLYSSTSTGHAHGIEDGRRIVGHFSARNGTNPFLWQPGNTGLIDLGTGEATDINNRTARHGQEAVGRKGSQATIWRIH